MHRLASACPYDARGWHAMTDDESAALGWLLRGQGKERKGIEYNTPEGPKVGYETAMAPGRAALKRARGTVPLEPGNPQRLGESA
jgi:hypothetical protein